MDSSIARFKRACREKGIIAALLKIFPYISFLVKKKNIERKWGNVVIKLGKLEIKGWNTGPKIYWDNRELTKQTGLNTSVFIDGRWHDSSKADWEPIEKTAQSLKMRNKWRTLPLNETWTIAITSDNKIRCNIELQTQKDIEFVEQKFTAMLSERFDQWSVDTNKVSDFPKFKGWIDIKEVKRDSLFIGAKSKSEKNLPEIVLKRIDIPERSFYVQIQNSDYKTKARLLNIVASSRDKRLNYKKGTGLFFNTEISVK